MVEFDHYVIVIKYYSYEMIQQDGTNVPVSPRNYNRFIKDRIELKFT